MICPRCQAQVPDGPDCPACGIVVGKYLARQQQDQAAPQAPPTDSSADAPPSGSMGSHSRATGADPAAVGASSSPRAPGSQRGPGPRKVSDRRLINLYSQLGRMVEAGIPVTEALRLASRNTRSSISRGLESVRSLVEGGETFTQASASEPGIFPEDSRVLLEAGEVTGQLPAAFHALSSAAELRLDVRRQIVRACIYPFVIFTLVFFIPKAHLLFTQGLGGYLQACLGPYLATLGVLVGVIWLLPKLIGLVFGRDSFQRVVRRIPVLKGLFHQSSTVRFSRHLANAMEAGLPILTSLRLAARSTTDPRWIETLARCESRIEQGATLYDALSPTGLFDDEFLLSLAGGERSGRLTESLEQHARVVQATFTHRLKVTVQIFAVLILLGTYFFVAQTIVSQFESVLGGASEQMDLLLKELGPTHGAGLEDLLKELGGPAGSSKLPPELREALK